MKRLKNSDINITNEYMIIEKDYIENNNIFEVLKDSKDISQYDRFIMEYHAFNKLFEIYLNLYDFTIEIYCTTLNLWTTDIKLSLFKKVDTYTLIENTFGLFLLRDNKNDYDLFEDIDINDCE